MAKDDFALYCCELLTGVGPCTAKRMFGGHGISTGGLTLALVTDLGGGETLWLKADAETRARFETEGCDKFTYGMTKNGEQVTHSLNYYSAPADAMESPQLMLPWARLALDCALRARASRAPRAPGRAAAKTPGKQRPKKKAVSKTAPNKTTKAAKAVKANNATAPLKARAKGSVPR